MMALMPNLWTLFPPFFQKSADGVRYDFLRQVSDLKASETEETAESDNDLLERVGRGDREGFSRYYDRFSGSLYSLALRMTNDRTEAEDALLEGMEEIWRKASHFDPTRASAFTWSVMIFRSRVIDRIRKLASRNRTRERAAAEQEASDDGVTGQSELVARREECALVRQVVDSLDPEPAKLLQLAFFEGMTHAEISVKTGRPLGTVKTTIRRTLIDLRRRITGEGGE
jgi:RNA polymerase sigma-70 factor (ECF subfamily)